MKALIKFSLLLFPVLFLSLQVFAQQTLTVENLSSPLKVNETRTVTVSVANATTDADLDISKFSWAGEGSFLDISSPTIVAGKIVSMFTGLKPTAAPVTITAKYDASTSAVAVTVLPQVSADTLTAIADVAMVAGGEKRINLTLTDLSPIPDGALAVKSEDPPTATATLEGNVIVIKAKRVSPDPIIVRVFSNGESVKAIKVIVSEGVDLKSLPSVTLKKGETKNLNDIFKTDTDKLVFSQPSDTGTALLDSAAKTLKGVSAKMTSFTVALEQNREITKEINITVTPNPEKIVFTGVENINSLTVGREIRITATVVSDEGETIPTAIVKLTLKDDSKNCIFITSLPNNVFIIKNEGGAECPATIEITAGTTVFDKPITEKLMFASKQVKGFSPLEVRLDVIDEQTAKDLFGKMTASEFYVAKVRLFNRVKDDVAKNTYFRNSILVYSESLEVKVAVQVKCGKDAVKKDKSVKNNKSGCGGNDGKDWMDLTENEAKITFPFLFPDEKYEKERCETRSQTDFIIPYRPLTFEMVTNTQDSRADRSMRSKVMSGLNGFSSLSSFVTTLAVPAGGTQLPAALDQFKNLLPSLEKLLPSTREIHRQNVIQFTMHALEEIPFGSDITKIIFFPKKPLRGIIPGKLVRISGISISDACAEVAIIQRVE